MGPAGNRRSESKGLVDTHVREHQPHRSFLIYRIYSAQKRGTSFPPKTFSIHRVHKKVQVDTKQRDIPGHYGRKLVGRELGPRPSRNPLPFFVALADNQRSPLFFNNRSYRVEREVSRHGPARFAGPR